MSSIMRCRSGLIAVGVGDAGVIEVEVMGVAPVRVTSVMGYSCLNEVVDPVIFRQEPTSRYRARITPSTPLARSALPRERFRSLTPSRHRTYLVRVRLHRQFDWENRHASRWCVILWEWC